MNTSEPPVGLPEGDLTGAITRLAAELFALAPGSAGHLPPVPGAASYLVSLYCSAAVLTDDAVGVLEKVNVDRYHDYP